VADHRAEWGAWVGCIAGALSKGEYEAGLAGFGFTGVPVVFTHPVGDGLHLAIKATKPTDAHSSTPLRPSRPAAPSCPWLRLLVLLTNHAQ
jgi:hypothetical protein